MTRTIEVVKKEVQVIEVDSLNPNPNIDNAININYDNSTSGLDSVNVQEAIDELSEEKYSFIDEEQKALLDNIKNDVQRITELEGTRINAGLGLGGGGILENDVTINLDMSELENDDSSGQVDVADEMIVRRADGRQVRVSASLLPAQGGFLPVGYVKPIDGDETRLEICNRDGSFLNGETILFKQAPPVDTRLRRNVDGYMYRVVLNTSQRQTGVFSQIQSDADGNPIRDLLFDQDQILWCAENILLPSGEGNWTQLEVGDALLSFNNRVGIITPLIGDYDSDLIEMADGDRTVDARILDLESESTDIEDRITDLEALPHLDPNVQETIPNTWSFDAGLNVGSGQKFVLENATGKTWDIQSQTENQLIITHLGSGGAELDLSTTDPNNYTTAQLSVGGEKVSKTYEESTDPTGTDGIIGDFWVNTTTEVGFMKVGSTTWKQITV